MEIRGDFVQGGILSWIQGKEGRNEISKFSKLHRCSRYNVAQLIPLSITAATTKKQQRTQKVAIGAYAFHVRYLSHLFISTEVPSFLFKSLGNDVTYPTSPTAKHILLQLR